MQDEVGFKERPGRARLCVQESSHGRQSDSFQKPTDDHESLSWITEDHGVEMLTFPCLQVLHGDPDHGASVHLLPGEQGP